MRIYMWINFCRCAKAEIPFPSKYLNNFFTSTRTDYYLKFTQGHQKIQQVKWPMTNQLWWNGVYNSWIFSGLFFCHITTLKNALDVDPLMIWWPLEILSITSLLFFLFDFLIWLQSKPSSFCCCFKHPFPDCK